MAGSPPNLHTMDSRSACIQDVLKVKVKVKDHVIRALSWILGMSYSVIDGLVFLPKTMLGRLTAATDLAMMEEDPKLARPTNTKDYDAVTSCLLFPHLYPFTGHRRLRIDRGNVTV